MACRVSTAGGIVTVDCGECGKKVDYPGLTSAAALAQHATEYHAPVVSVEVGACSPDLVEA